MKRRSFTSLLAMLLLLSCLVVPVFAAQAETGYVTDEAGILSSSECSSLERLASSISEQYDFGVYIVILRDYRDYSSSGVESCAVQWYDGNALGRGADNAGCLLLLSMEARDFVVDYYSSRADSIFTERARDEVENQFIPYLRSDDYYGGMEAFLNACAQCLDAAKNGRAEGAVTEDIRDALIIALIPGVIAALLAGIITMSPMRSARQKRDADQYAVHGGLHLRRRSDMFLRRTVTRRPRNTESSGGGGGHHSHSYSSGGHSGRSGKF